jgi:hypothetical protein
MLQLHVFNVNHDVDKVNEFLATHKPVGEIEFIQDQILVFIETGDYPAEYLIADLEELIRNVETAKVQQEIAMHTLEYERADVNMVKNKSKYEELSAGIQSCKKAMSMQDAKAEFLKKKIEALRSTK